MISGSQINTIIRIVKSFSDLILKDYDQRIWFSKILNSSHIIINIMNTKNLYNY